MRQPANMCAIRNTVVRNVGRKVLIRSNRGRNKYDVEEGFISDTYPSVFLVPSHYQFFLLYISSIFCMSCGISKE